MRGVWNDSCLQSRRRGGTERPILLEIEMKCGKKQTGFSLIELLIVVAIILIIAAIAIPNLLKAKITANEASAVGSLRTLNSACINYFSTYTTGFPLALVRLGPGTPATATAADLIDKVLSNGTKAGYRLVYVSGAPKVGKIGTYTINANPLTPNVTGTRYFYTDQTGVIRYSTGGAATIGSPPL
jgi:type IV pilus assembly protein PilA